MMRRTTQVNEIRMNEQNTFHSGRYERAPLSLYRKTVAMQRARRQGRLLVFRRPEPETAGDPKAAREAALRKAQAAREAAEQRRRTQ